MAAMISVLAVRSAAAETSPGAAVTANAPADTILVNGIVLTVDALDRVAQAVAIRGGKIIAVGSDDDIRKLAAAKTQVIDLQGRTATPGLIDTHAHIAEGGLSEVYGVVLKDLTRVADAVERVKARVAGSKPGAWVTGEGWDEGKLSERRYITARDLDVVSPDNPVWLGHTTGHYGVANSYALRLAKIDRTSRDPPAGTIDRDTTGVPSGVLKEAAQSLVVNLIPAPSAEQRRKGILASLELMHREGMTAVKDPAIDQPTWDAYRQLLDAGQLTAHVCVLWRAGATLESAQAVLARIRAQPRAPESLGRGTLVSCGAKIFMDGSGGARTAWVYQQWNKNSTDADRGNFGYATVQPEVYREQVKLFHAAGVNVGTHAIGDRAIDWVVDTYAATLEEKPTQGLRHTLIHANIPTEHALDVMANLQKQYDAGYPEMQPGFTWWIGDTYASSFGVQRAQRLVPLRSLQERGIRWAGGSDYPVTPLPARFGIWAASARETLKGTYGRTPFGVREAIDARQALRAYTASAAPLLFLEKQTGSLEAGKDADIAVWDHNWYSVPVSELKEIHCALTLWRGRIVYQDVPR